MSHNIASSPETLLSTSLPCPPMATNDSSSAQATHIVLFPFPAQGHINPFISLALLLHQHRPNLTVTLITTTQALESIRSSLPPSLPLRLHPLPFSPESFNLPPQTGTTTSLRFDQFLSFFHASFSLLPAFDSFISSIASNSNPVSIVSDIFFGWSVDVAHKYGAFHSILITSGSFGAAVFFSICTHLPKNIQRGDEFFLPEYPGVVLHKSQLPKYWFDDSLSKQWGDVLQRQILPCYKTDAMLANTVEEFEFTGLGMLRETFKMPVWTMGPMLRTIDTTSESDSCIINWLDSHKVGSVLFISFGSQNTIQEKQMMELALGLEAAGQPFMWVIRPPVGYDVRGEFKPEWLPEGFEERMRQDRKGLLIRGWAPQISILAHKSTGAFLSHCGWNSTLESLVHGVPIIGWPLSAEQFYNVMMLEKWGTSVELTRGNYEDSHVKRERVREVIDTVMGENEIRRNAREIKDLMENAWKEGGSSVNGFNAFLKKAGSTWKDKEKVDIDQWIPMD
ncbi:Glycosyltransferase [Rhynchospora pubera]|uniref:Glycosyltransferase n=1 Tax=Rhynchospora pubera TaxID=906938 RepID=A0AAV8EIN7_9POAL|nr:Glycosyltransferase [Rhynchospora pubera]